MSEQERQGERLRLGLIFNFDPSWMGGVIYLLNLVKTLDFLDDDKKPEILVFHRPELKEQVESIDYPYLKVEELTFPAALKGTLQSWVKGKNIFYDDLARSGRLDVLYPAWDFPVKSRGGARIIAWYADLQHKYYPAFFSRLNLLKRNMRLKLMLRNAGELVVSSQAVKDDFLRFFSVRKEMKIHIYHFVSILDPLPRVDFPGVSRKYGLPDTYFLVSNQFHKHKNHRVLLQALARLKGEGRKIHLAMTGKLPRAADSPYLAELHELINDHELSAQISILGVLPRDEQMLIMKHSRAVIQPSLFEGWSTVIEDARSLQVPVIASSLAVNREQLGDRGHYFDPVDPDELATVLRDFPASGPDHQPYEDYHVRVKNAAESLLGIFTKS